MQIESLKVFCDLVETKSFTKAAQINMVTQSAVSQTISALERRFSSRLIERSKKNFRLTPEGDVFYDYSKRILQTCDALRSRLQEIDNIIAYMQHLSDKGPPEEPAPGPTPDGAAPAPTGPAEPAKK